MTRQEMFDKAVRGLRRQGFQQCRTLCENLYRCTYDNGAGQHCAWGWVDESLKYGEVPIQYNVADLRVNRIGLATNLTEDDKDFAMALQLAHDNGSNPDHMESNLLRLAVRFDLVYPEA